MELAKRLKPANYLKQIILPIVVLSLLAIVLIITFGRNDFRIIFSVVMTLALIMHIIFYFQTKNIHYLIAGGFYLFSAITFLNMIFNDRMSIVLFAVLALIFFIGFMYILRTRKIKWRSREILELAAHDVIETADGYTSRPYFAGKQVIDFNHLVSFSKFLLKHGIAIPYIASDQITLVIPDNFFLHLLKIKNRFEDETYVSFKKDGKIISRFSQKSYKHYRQQYTYDQLCQSLSKLIQNFYSDFLKNEQSKILDKINALQFIV